VIVYGHHPPISSGYRGGFARYQRFIVPVLERHRVDVLLAGHDHHYERIGPLRGGTHLIIAGGGGATLRWTRWESSATKLEVVHHFLTMTITERELTIRAIDIEGKEFDRLSLRK
jgi:acid phosphatase